MENSLFIVKVIVDGIPYEYEYGNLKHAREHYDQEETAFIYEYKNGEYHFVVGTRAGDCGEDFERIDVLTDNGNKYIGCHPDCVKQI